MIAVCIGRKEQGKSTLGYFLIQNMPTRVIFDPKRNFSTSETREPDHSQLYELLNEKEEIIVQPPVRVPEYFAATCDEIMSWAEDHPDENFGFLVDEAAFAKTAEELPEGTERLMRLVPADNIRMVFTVHQPKHIATDIRAMANHFFIFQTTQEHDIKAIAERCGDEVAAIVPTLGPRELIHWDDDKQVYELFKNPRDWYVDIHPQRKESITP